MNYRLGNVSSASCDSFGFDRSLMSALGHAQDDPERFLMGCMKLAERSYKKVNLWFERDFSFLSPNDREDAMHDFYLTLARRLMTPRPQENIQEFGQDEQYGKLRFRRYLYTTARHAALDFAKKQISIQSYEKTLHEGKIADSAQILMTEIMTEDTELMLSDIKNLAKISDHEWRIFLASFEATSMEVASKLGVPSAEAVNSANHRVYNKLSKIRGQIVGAYGHVGSLILEDSEKICNL